MVVFTGWLGNVKLVGEKLVIGITALPDSVTVCGLPTALSVMVKTPVAEPVVVGTNVTLKMQLAPTATDIPVTQVVLLLRANSALVVTPEIVRAALPVFVRVTAWAEPLTPWLPNARTAGEMLTAGVSPVKAMVCGLPGASSAMLTAASCVPVALGVNVMLRAQFAPAASEAGQVLLKIANSDAFTPVMLTLEFKAALPVFVSTTV